MADQTPQDNTQRQRLARRLLGAWALHYLVTIGVIAWAGPGQAPLPILFLLLIVSGAVLLVIWLSMTATSVAQLLPQAGGRSLLQGRRLERLMNSIGDEIYVIDTATLRFLYVNQAAERGLGQSADVLLTRGPLDVTPEPERSVLEGCLEVLRRGPVTQRTIRSAHRRADGSRYPVELVLNYAAEEKPPVYVCVAKDITVRERAEQQLEFMAHHDPLTKLPNRVLFMDRLEQAYLTAQRQPGMFAVIFCDLDLFKRINDNLGHDAGDELLREVGRRLKANLRNVDTVARLAGDEFTILTAGIPDRLDAERLARKLLAAFESPIRIGDHDVMIGMSIGMTLFPLDNAPPRELLHHADQAMYAVKRAGRGDFSVYEPEISGAADRRVRLEQSLRHAIALDDLELRFAPIVSAQSGQIAALQSVIHWASQDLGQVEESEVLTTAQQAGMLEDLELWMLRAACEAAAGWDAAGASIPLILRLSTWQLRRRDFTSRVDELIERFGIDPAHLVIGLEEGGLLDALEGVTAGFDVLRATGVRFNVSEFGAGYQRLGRMPAFPVDYITISSELVAQLPAEHARTAVRTLHAAANSLGAKMIAPGVDESTLRDELVALGCDLMLGHAVGKPQPADQIAEIAAGPD